MAEIIVRMDTKTKEFSVTMDGKAVANVENVSLYRRGYDQDGRAVEDDDLCYFSMTQSDHDEDEGVRRYYQTSASEKGVVTEPVESVIARVAAPLRPQTPPPAKVGTAISKWYGQTRKSGR